MQASQYKQLEQDKAFKRHYMKKTLWWKNILLISPTLLLFIGLAGVLYMSNADKLWTWGIPYIVIFAIGTIWLKAIKKHIQDKILSKKDAYLVCAAMKVGDKKGRQYFIYSKDNKRHNEVLIKKLAAEIDFSAFTDEELKQANRKPLDIETSEEETPIYLKGFTTAYIEKVYRKHQPSEIVPLIYATANEIFVVRYKDLK